MFPTCTVNQRMPWESKTAVCGHRACARIELADVALRVPREPDVSVRIGNQPVRAGVLDLQRILLERSRLGVDAPKFVLQLFREPQRAVRSDGGIMRMRA